MSSTGQAIAVDDASGAGQHTQEHDGEHHEGIEWLEFARIAFVGAAILVSWFRLWQPYPKLDLVGLTAALIGGYPIFREAIADILSRRMTMELSMTIALGAALAIGEVFTALVIVFFVLIAEVLEEFTVGKGRVAIKELLEFLPASAEVRRGDQTKVIPIGDVHAGDVVIVRPGTRVPVDGSVVSGHSFVDQATITGESVPVEKMEGNDVYAGTINQSGLLEVRTATVGRNTAFGRIIAAVESAEQSQAPIQRTADRLSGYLVYFALGCAAVTYLYTHNIRSTISVVIVAGACGIAAGTPLAILGAIGRAARIGAIVKGGLYLERLGAVDTVVLDKTGTLTLGKPDVVGVHPAPGFTPHVLIQVAASAERFSEHPLGGAILERAAAMSIRTHEAREFSYTPGMGIRCVVNGDETLVGTSAWLRQHGVDVPQHVDRGDSASEVYVATGGVYAGLIQIADVLRSGAKEAIASIKAMRLKTVLLTGDSASIAARIAKELNVDDFAGDLLPEGKLKRVQDMRAQGQIVAMVGDGINDTPALVAASVGVAMGSGTDIARESASVLLLGDDLTRLAGLLGIARQCHRIIMTNFGGTLIVDGIGVGLAAFGLLNPVLAALIHVTSEMAFILNSARLLRKPELSLRIGSLAHNTGNAS
jgi:Cd2+/Zn2+-exporting ATPase/Cu+-exporting ATPase